MIDFRYHLVSIISVFLALAVGIVVGTTALNGVIVDDLRQRVDGLAADKRAREQTITEEQRTLAGANAFVTAVTPQEVAGQLAGRRITLISAPGVSADVRSSVTDVLDQSGATTVTRIRLSDAFADPTRAADIASVATDAARVQSVPLDASTSSAQRVAAAFAPAVVGTGNDLDNPIAKAAQRRALDPWRAAGLITVDQQDGPGDLALVLVPDPPDPRPDKDVLTPQVLALALALDERDDGTVVAGSIASADSGIVNAVRNAGTSSRVSTQDSVDTPWGLVGLIRTARAEAGGTAGQFGAGPGSRGPVPVPSSK
ncbi:MAG TPA: copper transporter [Frankiaceae bacterium]|nr:copper transporter [Frankiaceae bacterium]